MATWTLSKCIITTYTDSDDITITMLEGEELILKQRFRIQRGDTIEYEFGEAFSTFNIIRGDT